MEGMNECLRGKFICSHLRVWKQLSNIKVVQKSGKFEDACKQIRIKHYINMKLKTKSVKVALSQICLKIFFMEAEKWKEEFSEIDPIIKNRHILCSERYVQTEVSSADLQIKKKIFQYTIIFLITSKVPADRSKIWTAGSVNFGCFTEMGWFKKLQAELPTVQDSMQFQHLVTRFYLSNCSNSIGKSFS